MPERYVRPPLVGPEAPSAWAAAWRFRLVTLILLAALVFAGYLAFSWLSVTTGENPGLTPVPTRSP